VNPWSHGVETYLQIALRTMREQTHKRDMSDEPNRQDLEDRVDQLESTISKMLPSRRDALKLGGAALVGGAAMSGTASAGTQQAGTIGTATEPVDVESEDINNADTVTTQDLVVNGTATGPFGGGGVVLESGDSITVEFTQLDGQSESFVTLYNGSAKDVLGGVITAGADSDFLYTFDDNTTIRKNGTGTTYTQGNNSVARDQAGDNYEVDILPPAKNVVKVEVASRLFDNVEFGAEVILKD